MSTIPKVEDLSETLRGLTSCIELAMKNLYDLQTATINATGETIFAMRSATSKLERNSNPNVQLLRTSLLTATKSDIGDLLEEMLAKCKQDATMAAQLTAGHSNVLAVYLQYRDNFRYHLDHPKSQPMKSLLFKSSRHQPTGPTGSPQPKLLEHGFFEDSIASLHPDGNQAMAAFESAMEEIHANLSRLSIFLTAQHLFCQRGLDSLYHPSHSLTPRQLQEYADSWVTYQSALMKAIKDITRTCDAVMIDAVGAPHHTPTSPPEEALAPWNVVRSAIPFLARVGRPVEGHRHDNENDDVEIDITITARVVPHNGN
ncbi:SubName: Full=Uncharacterized protein {ECO:0000313/EMBL:CCA73658.1} [Serendipita indica DSM 11827]|nr:SubName: Full=Uncharacterized protein {ECO:0000313/EMBL:CCA73658.1} [Serendipita indica DSM 11827]